MKGSGESAVYIALYVDDLFVVGMLLANIKVVKEGLGREFKMKDLERRGSCWASRFVVKREVMCFWGRSDMQGG